MGKTKRGKGTKVMASADRAGLPLTVHVVAASPHEATLVEPTLAKRVVEARPEHLVEDKAYGDPLDAYLAAQGMELSAPHWARRKKPKKARWSPGAAVHTPPESGTALGLVAELQTRTGPL